MLTKSLALIGVVLALFGVFAAPGLITRGARRRAAAIRRVHPDSGDAPWDLTGFMPVGWVEKREWAWGPRFRVVE